MASLRLEVRACMSGLMSTYLHENRCIDVYIQKEVSCLSEIWREVLFCCFCCSKVLEFSCDSLIIIVDITWLYVQCSRIHVFYLSPQMSKTCNYVCFR